MSLHNVKNGLDWFIFGGGFATVIGVVTQEQFIAWAGTLVSAGTILGGGLFWLVRKLSDVLIEVKAKRNAAFIEMSVKRNSALKELLEPQLVAARAETHLARAENQQLHSQLTFVQAQNEKQTTEISKLSETVSRFAEQLERAVSRDAQVNVQVNSPPQAVAPA